MMCDIVLESYRPSHPDIRCYYYLTDPIGKIAQKLQRICMRISLNAHKKFNEFAKGLHKICMINPLN